MNVYCDTLLEIVGNKAIYTIGSMGSDVTGKIEVNTDTGEYKILKEPDIHPLYDRAIRSMIGKYLGDMKRGIIPERMSREVG